MQEPLAGGGKVVSVSGLLVLVGGGEVDGTLLRRLGADGATIVAADGGAQACERAGVVPKAIIGDMDSLENVEKWEQKTNVIRLAEQATTDFEKCIYSTSAPVTVALGMVGDRLDHTLSAFDVAGRYAAKRAIIIAGRSDAGAVVSGRFGLKVLPGARVSVLPLAPVSITRSQGLTYPLDGLELAPGVKSGISNQATTGRFAIEPAGTGAYVVLVGVEYLDTLTGALGTRNV
jgi:thiamine pyrophosphokinase